MSHTPQGPKGKFPFPLDENESGATVVREASEAMLDAIRKTQEAAASSSRRTLPNPPSGESSTSPNGTGGRAIPDLSLPKVGMDDDEDESDVTRVVSRAEAEAALRDQKALETANVTPTKRPPPPAPESKPTARAIQKAPVSAPSPITTPLVPPPNVPSMVTAEDEEEVTMVASRKEIEDAKARSSIASESMLRVATPAAPSAVSLGYQPTNQDTASNVPSKEQEPIAQPLFTPPTDSPADVSQGVKAPITQKPSKSPVIMIVVVLLVLAVTGVVLKFVVFK